MSVQGGDDRSSQEGPFERRAANTVRAIVVAGILCGVVLIGLGSRLAMLLLRVTSPDSVIGLTSDDDFVIGRFTLAGTYNLLVLGAVFGVIGAGSYRLVARWLIGPLWFRRVTVGLASAAVVGSMLVHAKGIDFVVLKPTWLAIGLFVALPGLFGTFIGSVVDSVERSDSWTAIGRRRWLLPLVGIACFPLTIAPVILVGLITMLLTAVGEFDNVRGLRASLGYSLIVRAFWMVIAVVGLKSLVVDIAALT